MQWWLCRFDKEVSQMYSISKWQKFVDIRKKIFTYYLSLMAAVKQFISDDKKLIRYIQPERNQKKNKENNLGKGQQSRKLVEKQELSGS